MGRPIDDAEARRCFGCHTTASTTAAGFAASRAIPGVTCEACHGPGRAHVNAMERGGRSRAGRRHDPQSAAPRRERFGGPLRRVPRDVLGRPTGWRARHRGAPLAAVPPAEQPLLERRSAAGLRRVPRSALAARSRSRVLRFAVPGVPPVRHRRPPPRPTPRSCPVATNDCVTCHMPKYDVPEMHYAFTDHLIRIPAAAR